MTDRNNGWHQPDRLQKHTERQAEIAESRKVQPTSREDAQPVQIDPATVETAIVGSYDMPDGRKFWIDVPVAREMTNRVLAALQAEQKGGAA